MADGDRKAYFESAEWTKKVNRQKVADLSKENKEIRKVIADKLAADEVVVSKGLEDHPKERNAFRNKPGAVAIVKMDEKVRDNVNILNNLRYQTVKRAKRLEELQTQYDQMVKDASNAVATDAGESKEAQKLRDLENRLDKAVLKCKEAEHIRKTYEQIKAKLEEEHSTFETTLNDVETEIKMRKAEKKELQQMCNDSFIARDAAKKELEDQEKTVYDKRKKRELELNEVRKEAEEKKMQHERTERRIAGRGSITEELTEGQRQALTGENEEQKIQVYEEIFHRIKEATGVSDTKEVVLRFELQNGTREQLEGLKRENEKTISRLREEKEKLQEEYEEMKYSGEAKLSSGQRMLEEFESHLEAEESKQAESQDRLKRASDIMVEIKSGVEHLSEKLRALKAASSQVNKTEISKTSDEYVLDQLSTCEEKLLRLLEELEGSGRDVPELQTQMEEEEYHNTVEPKLPSYNTRINMPQAIKDTMFDDDEESGDDAEIPTRDKIKDQSRNIIESKTRRRVGKRKKKAK